MDRTAQLLNTLPGQIIRSIEEQPIDYNIIIMGESNTGKTSLIRSLFKMYNISGEKRDEDFYHEVYDTACTSNPVALLLDTAVHSLDKNNISISAMKCTLNENGVRMNLTVYEIGGIGDSVNSFYDWVPAKNLVQNRYEEYHMEEDHGLLKHDKRIHVCLYLLNPVESLRQIDVESMYEMGKVSNVIPVISKTDMLSNEVYIQMKEKMFSHLISEKVQLFDSIFIDECKKVVELNFMPLKYTTPGREYFYGSSSSTAENEIKTLRNLLITQHLIDLKEVTDAYYETYRRKKLIIEILITKNSGISEDFRRKIKLEESKIKKSFKRLEEKKISYQMLIAQYKNTMPSEFL